ELVVGIFAVLMSGAGYLPIDVSVPDERKRFMSHDVGSFVKMDDHFVFDSCSEDSDRAFQRKALPPNVLDHNIAYVIFTSGSTGTPKGSLVSQKNVVRLFEQTNIEFDFSVTDRWSFFHSPGFDFSVWEIFGPILRGDTCIVVPMAQRKRPEELFLLLNTEQVTNFSQTPSDLSLLLPLMDEQSIPSLR